MVICVLAPARASPAGRPRSVSCFFRPAPPWSLRLLRFCLSCAGLSCSPGFLDDINKVYEMEKERRGL